MPTRPIGGAEIAARMTPEARTERARKGAYGKAKRDKIAAAASDLFEHGRVNLRTNMGNCQCGDTYATLSLRSTGAHAIVEGSMNWQHYAGPADQCWIPYGMGETIRAIAAATKGTEDPTVDWSLVLTCGTEIVR